jgi:hypothetical protein
VELTSNSAVDNTAIAWLLRLERGAGRDAVDTRGTGAAAPVSSPPRLIEVEAYGRSARGQDLWLGAMHAGLEGAVPWLTAVLVDREESSWMVWNCCKS